MVRGVEVPPDLDPRVVRFELPSDMTPAKEGPGDTEDNGDAAHGGADLALGDAPGYIASFARVKVVGPGRFGPAPMKVNAAHECRVAQRCCPVPDCVPARPRVKAATGAEYSSLSVA